MCLALHAGWSTFHPYDGCNSRESHPPSSDTWCVVYLTDVCCLDATIHTRSRDTHLQQSRTQELRLAIPSKVRTIKYTGQTWCVNVPKIHFCSCASSTKRCPRTSEFWRQCQQFKETAMKASTFIAWGASSWLGEMWCLGML